MKSTTTLNKCKESDSLKRPMSEHACILLGVWGEGYIHDFLNLSLPSLLAPGNIPTLSATYKTRFVFLTRYADIPRFADHPAFLRLKTYCDVEFVTIDDLLLIEFYSISLTLAYDRAIKQTGPTMLNTYFIFLTADFIFADGALTGLTRYMQQGYSGICAANFQVLKEGLTPYLLEHFDAAKQNIAIKPRELLAESFKHLHPITVANVYRHCETQPLRHCEERSDEAIQRGLAGLLRRYAPRNDGEPTHNYRSNRFYLRYNEETLAGRFYLQHMLCIKPETQNYTIAESCDYSFIPAMCPSGNVTVVNDSDDYLVVEIQAKAHELNHVSKGPYQIPKLARSLASWTTATHRENAKQTIFFHTQNLSPADKQAINTQLDSFVADVALFLDKYPPRPVINPKWAKTVEIFTQQLAAVQERPNYEYVDLTPPTYSNPLKRWFYRILGTPPAVSRFHYNYRQYQSKMRELTARVKKAGADNTIVVYENHQPIFMKYCGWLQKALGVTQHYYLPNLLLAPEKMKELEKKFALCVVFTTNPSGLLWCYAPRNDGLGDRSPDETRFLRFIRGDSANCLIIPYHHDNSLALQLFKKIDHLFSHNKNLKFFFYLLLGTPGSLLYFIYNCMPSKKGAAS